MVPEDLPEAEPVRLVLATAVPCCPFAVVCFERALVRVVGVALAGVDEVVVALGLGQVDLLDASFLFRSPNSSRLRRQFWLESFWSLRGLTDLFGRAIVVTADELPDLVQGRRV